MRSRRNPRTDLSFSNSVLLLKTKKSTEIEVCMSVLYYLSTFFGDTKVFAYSFCLVNVLFSLQEE